LEKNGIQVGQVVWFPFEYKSYSQYYRSCQCLVIVSVIEKRLV